MMKVTVSDSITPEKVDWSKPGLVEAGDDFVVLYGGDSTNYQFSGTTLRSSLYGTGHHSSHWVKDHFKPFRGTVTIEG